MPTISLDFDYAMPSSYSGPGPPVGQRLIISSIFTLQEPPRWPLARMKEPRASRPYAYASVFSSARSGHIYYYFRPPYESSHAAYSTPRRLRHFQDFRYSAALRPAFYAFISRRRDIYSFSMPTYLCGLMLDFRATRFHYQ